MSHWYHSTPEKSRRELDSNPGSRQSTSFEVSGVTRPGQCPTGKAGFDPGSDALQADALPYKVTEARRGQWDGGPTGRLWNGKNIMIIFQPLSIIFQRTRS